MRLPRRLPGDGATPFSSEAPGDLCYYAPWGNLALFYAGYTFSAGLIRLGRMDGWQEALRVRGPFRFASMDGSRSGVLAAPAVGVLFSPARSQLAAVAVG